MTVEVERILEVSLYRPHLHITWWALTTGISKGFAENAIDEAFLMQCLSDVAKQDKETPDQFKMRMTYQQWRAIWHVMNMLQKNNLIESDDKRVGVTQIQFWIAGALDSGHLMDTPPELVTGTDMVMKPVKGSKTLLIVE